MERECDVCKKIYNADSRNLKRGWSLCCSKSCAAKKREMSKPGYDLNRVLANNLKREGIYDSYKYKDNDRYPFSYEGADDDQWGDCDFGIHD